MLYRPFILSIAIAVRFLIKLSMFLVIILLYITILSLLTNHKIIWLFRMYCFRVLHDDKFNIVY